MAEITNEQKLYVLLDNIRDKSELEQEIWGVIYDHVSPDDAWKKGVAELLVKSAYLDRGYAFSNQESWWCIALQSRVGDRYQSFGMAVR